MRKSLRCEFADGIQLVMENLLSASNQVLRPKKPFVNQLSRNQQIFSLFPSPPTQYWVYLNNTYTSVFFHSAGCFVQFGFGRCDRSYRLRQRSVVTQHLDLQLSKITQEYAL